MKSIDIVVPIFNEEEAIPLFLERLQNVLASLSEYEVQILFANNASQDRSLELIEHARRTNPHIHYVTLSRNFGYQANLMAALRHSDADATIIIDVDCEDPPELIPEFIRYWQQGYSLVYGERGDRPEPSVLVLCRKLFYRLTRSIADSDFILDMAEFALFSRELRESVLSNKTTHPFIRCELAFTGFTRKAVPYSRQRRIAGTTHYNIWRMFEFAIAGILTSSTFPLRLITYSGIGLTAMNMFDLASGLLTQQVLLHSIVERLNWLFVIFSLSSSALYIARIYKDGVQRPLYVVDYRKSSIKRPPLRTERT